MKFLPIVKRVTVSVPSGGPNFITPDKIGRQTSVGIGMSYPDKRGRSTTVGAGFTFNGKRGRSTTVTSSMSYQPPDRVGRSSKLTATISLLAVARSATPDNDEWGDAWTHAALGQIDVNHGNEAQLQCQNTLGEKRAFMKINLLTYGTRYTATGNAHGMTIYVGGNGSGLAAVVLTLAFGVSATSPFTESTITRLNQPAMPTLFTKTINVPAGAAFLPYNITFTDAEMQQLLGQWVLIVLTVPALTTSTLNPRGREDTNKPSLNFKVTL